MCFWLIINHAFKTLGFKILYLLCSTLYTSNIRRSCRERRRDPAGAVPRGAVCVRAEAIRSAAAATPAAASCAAPRAARRLRSIRLCDIIRCRPSGKNILISYRKEDTRVACLY